MRSTGSTLAGVRPHRTCSSAVWSCIVRDLAEMKRLRWQAEWAWVAAVLALLVLSYFWVPAGDRDGLDTFSTAAGGKRAFFNLAERLAHPVSRELESLYSA